ncbi:ABC transporter permease [Micromonospora ureilytica]|uniref:ABC transporter permease n=1 Tax=Micromonospora ureilytica TaxID=709868 RepID=A0A3N9XR50_9ACTN|nr:ABC transporter permease [Micromonospora ureilytica]RQX15588.1 ABC transporter permease [Micromonospora ureilytica]
MTTTTAPAAGAVAPRQHSSVRRPSLLRLSAVEVRKLVDTRAGRWLLITIGLVTALIVTLQLIYSNEADQTFPNFFVPSLLPVSVLLPVLGILSITSEWSQRTALTTYALVPRRERVVVAKLIAVMLTALASVLASLVFAAVGTLVASATGGAGTWIFDWSLLLNAVILQVTGVLTGAAFGLLLLNPPLAIVGYFLLPTLWGVLGEMVKPLRGPSEWLDTSKTMEPLFSSDAVTGGQWGRIVVSLLVWMVLPLAAGLFRTLRREVS